MAKRKKENLEYRHYELSQDFPVMALWGDKWIQTYEKFDCLHFHNHLEIGYCNWGEGDLYIENEIYRYKSGTITFIPQNIPHSTDSEKGTISSWEYIFVDIEHIFKQTPKSMDVWDMGYNIKSISNKPYIFSENNSVEIAVIIKTIINEMKNPNGRYKTKIRALLMMLFIEIERLSNEQSIDTDAKVDVQIMPALEYIRYNYMKDIKISDLAYKCNLSETHFRRIFKEIMRMSPLDYINEVRIHASCNLLKSTNESVESIALKSGYTTITTYNRNFSKIMGITPLKWRKKEYDQGRNLSEYNVKKLEGWL